MLGDRRVVHGKVVDEHAPACTMSVDDPLQRLALAAAIADHLMGDPEACELLDPAFPRLFAKVGQDHDVGLFSDRPKRFHRARDNRLAVHLRFEKAPKVPPHLFARNPLSGRAELERSGHVPILGPEQHVMLLLQPSGEMPNHVKQDLVTVGDEQGT
jgi:hypothetical protein